MGVQEGPTPASSARETDALDPAYQAFLAAYIPALIKELSYLDILDQCFFHLTDAASQEDREQFMQLMALTGPLLSGVKVLAAMPDPAFIPDQINNLVPTPGFSQLERFSGVQTPCRWASLNGNYRGGYADSLIAMPGSRARVLGTQLFVMDIQGISHWALNYYAAEVEGYPIDPYMNTDCDGLSPAGDAFLIYPGQGGIPEESIRMMLFLHAIQDLRALRGLEAKIGRDQVLALIKEYLKGPLSLKEYPGDQRLLLNLRHQVNLALLGAG